MLVVCSTLDLSLPYGFTPGLWQLLKAFFENGCEVVATPYVGRGIRSLWWRAYPNPCFVESSLYRVFTQVRRKAKTGVPEKIEIPPKEGVSPKLARRLTTPKWRNHITQILQKESDIEGVLFIQVPLNHIGGLASHIRKEFGIPCLYYEVDVPTSLPKFGGFSFNHFINADLSEYDAFIIPSEGSKDDLLELGAEKVFIVHFGVDIDVYQPVKTPARFDVFFSGNGSRNRENFIESLIGIPSKSLKAQFLVSGAGFRGELGKAENIPAIPFSSWRNYVCASRINLNIARENHALTYATSTSRPFELAAMKSCIVSCNYLGLEKWFSIGKEIFVAQDAAEAIELYTWLLGDEDTRIETGSRAYNRVVRDHQYTGRAKSILNIFDSF